MANYKTEQLFKKQLGTKPLETLEKHLNQWDDDGYDTIKVHFIHDKDHTTIVSIIIIVRKKRNSY